VKILITGINGLLGSELAGILEQKHEVSGLDISGSSGTRVAREVHNVDLTDYAATFASIIKINPDIVIHTAANANVDQCETVPSLAYRMNALATRNVALACQKFDAAMLYISTDYVFRRTKHPKNGFTEFDAPDPVGVYGVSKYRGEVYVRELLNRHYIVRTSWLFGKKRNNFVSQTAEALLSGKPSMMVTDMISSPTNVKDLSAAISFLIESNIFGTYHITNSGFASRYQIGLEIAKMMKLPAKNIKKTVLAKLKLPAPRPDFSALRNYVWELNGFQPLRPWQEAVAEFLKEKKYI
jgi:dTDP-4-dehydrorhamnose reductase